MKLNDIKIKGYVGLKKNNMNDLSELFYLFGLNTLHITYNEKSKEIISIILNNEEIVDNKDKIKLLNLTLNSLKPNRILKISDIDIDKFNPIDILNNYDIVSKYYYIEHNTLFVSYSKKTGIIYNLYLNDFDILNNNLDKINIYQKIYKKKAK